MDFSSSPDAVAFREEVRELVASTFTAEVRRRAHETGTMHDWGLHRAIGARGWLQQALPEALGGGGATPRSWPACSASSSSRARPTTASATW